MKNQPNPRSKKIVREEENGTESGTTGEVAIAVEAGSPVDKVLRVLKNH